jgi:TolB-like protein/Tfp pilus assembly protein PilF
LTNLSNDPAQAYLSIGMADELATVLAKTGVRVIASDSIHRLRPASSLEEIGRQLQVEAVIDGSVLGSGDRVRINARLIDVRTARLVWADSYERSLQDVLGLQSEVADAIAREIRASVTPGPKPGPSGRRLVVPDAYRAYLRGRFFWNKRTEAGLRKAIESFNEAIARDGSYAPAYAGLADSYALLGSNFYDAIPPREAMPLAKKAARRALELDPQLAEAHTSLGYVLMVYDWDLPAAEKEFRQAFRSNPSYTTAHHWYGHYLLAAGHPDQAAAEMKIALALDPLSLPVNVGAGWCSYFARRYDEAIVQYRKALELEPDFALARQALAMALERKGAYTEAIAEFRKAVALSGGSASTLASLGHACALAGATAEARAQLDRLEELSRRKYVPAMYRAFIYLGLGDKDRAAVWLAKAYEERSEYFIYYRADPSFDSIRGDRRFAAMLKVR